MIRQKKASAKQAGSIITMTSNYYMGYQHESLEKLQFYQAVLIDARNLNKFKKLLLIFNF
jgi:hypothetical protein